MARLDHLAIFVTDHARSRDWYTKHIGLKVEFEIPERKTVALQDDGDLTLFLVEHDARVPPSCILTFQVADVDEKYRELHQAGVAFENAPQRLYWGYGAELRDPDGCLVCLWDERSMREKGERLTLAVAILEPITTNVWVAARRLRFFGVETGTRMTVVRLAGGALFVHSPIPLDDAVRAAVDGLGPVKAIVAPSLFHHLSVGEWIRAYPNAVPCACPGLERKRRDLPWQRVLGDEPEPEWRGELEQVFFGARSLENEVVFFHRASGTMICADAVFNLAHHPSLYTRIVARLMGNGQPGATYFERILIRDRAAARTQVDRMLGWQAERIILAHGDLIPTGGREVLRRAYAWL